MPRVIPYNKIEEYNWDVIGTLYEYKFDEAPNYLDDSQCDIQVVCEIDNYNFPPKINYEAIEKCNWDTVQYTITNTNVKHQMLDKMIFPEILLHERPCKFTSKQMYDITRQYILDHIDNSVAKITSNYDFCFTVKKLIPLIEPKIITYQNIFATTKRERNKIHTTVKKFEEKEIFEMTHDQRRYDNYTVIPEMCANSEAELKEKVDAWLEGLMEIINEPLCQCPQCQGTGYIGEIKKEGFSYEEATK
jgi:excinuclease UvrABC ATPase subunit